MIDFPALLIRLRTKAGLSLPQLAEQAGLSRQCLHQLENGTRRPTWDTVCRLADALHIKTDAFRK